MPQIPIRSQRKKEEHNYLKDGKEGSHHSMQQMNTDNLCKSKHGNNSQNDNHNREKIKVDPRKKNITWNEGIQIHDHTKENQGKLQNLDQRRKEGINSKEKENKNHESKNKGKRKMTIDEDT